MLRTYSDGQKSSVNECNPNITEIRFNHLSIEPDIILIKMECGKIVQFYKEVYDFFHGYTWKSTASGRICCYQSENGKIASWEQRNHKVKY